MDWFTVNFPMKIVHVLPALRGQFEIRINFGKQLLSISSLRIKTIFP